jgi:diketogulonate reductase-like aldo/keto reductase
MRAIGSVEQMASVLEAAAKIGINHIETAPAYGPAEQFLGEGTSTLFHHSRRWMGHNQQALAGFKPC